MFVIPEGIHNFVDALNDRILVSRTANRPEAYAPVASIENGPNKTASQLLLSTYH